MNQYNNEKFGDLLTSERVVNDVKLFLGAPVVDVELTEKQIEAAMSEAVYEFLAKTDRRPETLNDILWIRKYSFSICKEILGRVRSKFGPITTPGAIVEFDGSKLIKHSKLEKEKLLRELKDGDF